MELDKYFIYGNILSAHEPLVDGFMSNGKRVEVEKGTHIYWQEAHADKIYYLADGILAEYALNSKGTTKLCAIRGGRCVVGIESVSSGASPVMCRTLCNCVLYSLSISELHNLEPRFMQSLLAYTIYQARQMQNQLRLLNGSSGEVQALEILREYKELQNIRPDFRLTRQMLADMIGLTRGHISKILSKHGLQL